MRRATGLVGLVGFLAAVITAAIQWQICVPCLALGLGAGAGYLACRAARPADQNSATRLGATSGALAGALTLLGNVVGGLIAAATLGPQGAEARLVDLARSLGLTVPATPISPVIYYASALGSSACCGVGVIFVMAVLGGLAGTVWFRQTRGDVPKA